MFLSKTEKEIRYGITQSIREQLMNGSVMMLLILLHVGVMISMGFADNYKSLFINMGVMLLSAYLLTIIAKRSIQPFNANNDLINGRVSESMSFQAFIRYGKLAFLLLLIVDIAVLYFDGHSTTIRLSAEPELTDGVIHDGGLFGILSISAINAFVASFYLGLVNIMNVIIAVRLLERKEHAEARNENPVRDIHYTIQSAFFGVKCCILPVFILTLAVLLLNYMLGLGVSMSSLRDIGQITVSLIATVYAVNHYFCSLRSSRG
ncbi:hypothetical protein LMH73_024525 [Vibrio splendidus]|nr:hypothetical protein [Vibrio splendidus]MCC4880845.1 hypothetical protein [Vibrio splendidus]